MYGVRIRTIGRVAIQSRMKGSAGYLCDIPTDPLGFPCIPLKEMLQDYPFPVDGVEAGFARPAHYTGLVREACDLEKQFPNDREYVRDIYTNDHYYREKGTHVRTLRSGIDLIAPIRFRAEDEGTIGRFLQTIKQIGIRKKGISGKVEVALCMLDEENGNDYPMNALCSYTSLEYAIHLISPAVLYAPYENGATTYLYMHGADVRKALAAAANDPEFSGLLAELQFSHAYISAGGKRMLPVPLCMSVVKLDKEQLRYRLSPGKDPSRVEQDAALSNAYATDFQQHFMRYTKPETERVATFDGSMYDALSAGQAFRGTVFGTDAQLRAVADYIRKHPRFNIGKASEEGFGEAYLEVCDAKEAENKTEDLYDCFDVACLSDTLLLDDDGKPSSKAEELISEIERKLGIPGGLEIAGKYTDMVEDFHYNFEWEQDGPVVRCVKAGSVLRVQPRDGKPVDIFPIRHCFLGENTRNGYGEIMAYPAVDQYYRVTEQVAPPKYTMKFTTSYEKMERGAELVSSALEKKLQSMVINMAAIDREEIQQGAAPEDITPSELLQVMKDNFAPKLDLRTVHRWYRKGLEDEKHV